MNPTIGRQELALLQDIEEHDPSTVGEAFSRFGRTQSIARSTVLTMMERLRAKGYLTRTRRGHAYQYAVVTRTADARRSSIAQFVERTLGGSIAPLCAFMAERGSITRGERASLEELLRQLDDGTEEKK